MNSNSSLGRGFRVGPVAVAGLVALLGVSVASAQFDPEYWATQAEIERARAQQARALERERYEAILAQRSASAHARMAEEGAFSDSIGSVDWRAAHPNVFSSRTGQYSNYTFVTPPQRNTPWPRPLLDFPIWQDVAPEGEPLDSLYSEYISGPIVQTKCIVCHVEGGLSGHTPLVFSRSTAENYVSLNQAVFETYVATIENGVDRILEKVRGVGHQGGDPVPSGTDNYANLERFLRQLDGDTSTGSTSGVTAATLFDGVTMASPSRTLRRAAILFAGRLPSQDELNAVQSGLSTSLRTSIRSLMDGPEFHDFLIRGANDRLLTDRQLDQGVIPLDSQFFYALNQQHVEMRKASVSRGFSDTSGDPDYWTWDDAVRIGLARAPLELIAHVVENDKPYTEILTADYVMANPQAAAAYGDSTIQFDNANDPFEFKPSKIVSYYRDHESRTVERDENDNYDIVTNPGSLATENYPHAGILNTTAFMRRYPSTATNRNRARSRWTYYHFLGDDIEGKNQRPTDAAALLDTDNPTMNNPACIVCHQQLDPVAGSFQNYGDEGLYRDQEGGLDSLPWLFKRGETGSTCAYVHGDTWYCDMRTPGFGTEVAPSADNSLQWLAERIVASEGFAEAAVKFWWPAIMGVPVATAPQDSSDPNYEARLVAFEAQNAEIKRLARHFRFSVSGGGPYNGKDLLTEIALSPWFRAESYTGDDAVRTAALQHAGVSRLLTPEELNRKTQAVAGYVWGRAFRRTASPESKRMESGLDGGPYETLYGGIDSDGIIRRAGDITPVMAAVAQSHAAEVSCPIVRREFFFWEDDRRLLFDGVSRYDSPVSERFSAFDVSANSRESRQTFSLDDVSLLTGAKTLRLAFENDYEDEEGDRNLHLDRLAVYDSEGNSVTELEFEHLGKGGCGRAQGPHDSHYTIWGDCSFGVPINITYDDIYQIDIIAFQDQAGDEPARLSVTVESDDGVSAGAKAIRNKLVDLHRDLFGVDVAPDSADVNEAYNLFFEVWARKRRTEGAHYGESNFGCHIHGDQTYYDQLVENPLLLNMYEWAHYDWDDDAIEALYEETDMNDPTHAVRAWVVTLAFLMTDYRYLYY